jgi:hypothetical protein
MKMIVALVSVLAAGYSLGSGVTPVQKVISMMEEMKAKGEAEKETEAKLYSEYMTWCKDTGVSKSQSIETATNKIETRPTSTMSCLTLARTPWSSFKHLGEDTASR